MTIYDNRSSSNPSLITAGLPSSSLMTSRLIQSPSTTTKQNYYFNQNRATDTQPISLHSQSHTTLSHRTTSDIYLNLSQKDIDDLMTALHTLAHHVQNDMISNSLRINRRRSLSSDCWFDHYLNLVEASLKSLSSHIPDQYK